MKRVRITSIDALRALTLLGILIVHTYQGFGFIQEHNPSGIDVYLGLFERLFFKHKFNIIFGVLFGISFYLILKNPLNSNAKFIWRCFLLMLIGFLNKFFYSYDILMWYGLCGMFLVPIRQFKTRNIFILFLFLVFLETFLRPFKIGDLLLGMPTEFRYVSNATLLEILSYPNAVIDHLRIVCNNGFVDTLSKFVLGYWVARTGILENLDKNISKKMVSLLWCLYVFSFAIVSISEKFYFFRLINNYLAAFAYSSIILYMYYHTELFHKMFVKLEPYGKMGLTNYSMQGIFGVLVMGSYGLNLCQQNYSTNLSVFLLFFLFQAIFSYYWLSFFRYGPMEYLWRICTERKIIEFRHENKYINQEKR